MVIVVALLVVISRVAVRLMVISMRYCAMNILVVVLCGSGQPWVLLNNW